MRFQGSETLPQIYVEISICRCFSRSVVFHRVLAESLVQSGSD